MNKSLRVFFAALLLCLAMFATVGSASADAPKPQMVKLGKGVVRVYRFPQMTLHSFSTGNPMNEETFILETPRSLILAEPPAFNSSLSSMVTYIKSLKKPVAAVLTSYHVTGANYLKGARIYTSPATARSVHRGAIGRMLNTFRRRYGRDFNPYVLKATDTITEEVMKIAGVDFIFYHNGQGYDFEVPEIGVLYTHMLGADTHAFATSLNDYNSQIAGLCKYAERNVNLVISSHHAPEDACAIYEKIDYLGRARDIAWESAGKRDFKANMKAAYPKFKGLHYLDMTADAVYRW